MELFDKIINLENERKSLKNIPKDFNSFFAEHGWVATDDTPVPLMTESLRIAKKSGREEAEFFICNYLTPEFCKNSLRRMTAIWVYKDRQTLIELAYEDHKEKRYHASVPVILSQIEGLVRDIAHESTFFTGKEGKISKFKYESPVTGLIGSLDVLAGRLGSHRTDNIENDPLSIPYRHGILHGKDINYNNVLVSSKCFFTLFSLRTWALFIQQNELSRRQNNHFKEIPNFKAGIKLTSFISSLLE